MNIVANSDTTKSFTKPATNFAELSQEDQQTVALYIESLDDEKNIQQSEINADGTAADSSKTSDTREQNKDAIELPPFDYKVDDGLLSWSTAGIVYYDVLIFNDDVFEADFEEFVVSFNVESLTKFCLFLIFYDVDTYNLRNKLTIEHDILLFDT